MNEISMCLFGAERLDFVGFLTLDELSIDLIVWMVN